LEYDFDRYIETMKHWPYEGALPYAIIAFDPGVTPQAPPNSRVLFQRNGVIVAQQTGNATCDDHTPALDQLKLAPRGWTLAEALSPLLHH
jgi:hypothetical protein